MSNYFGAICDEFFVSTRLHLKLELPNSRETVLHFFERVRREFPNMDRMRRRGNGGLVLEQSDESANPMWVRLDPNCLRFGEGSPPNLDQPRRLARLVLEQAPFHLSLSELDIDRLELVYSFDLDYGGNHDQLVAETFFSDHPFAGLINGDHATHVIECQPCLGVALTRECDTQAYMELRSRSTTYEASRGQFDPKPLTVSLTTRRYWSAHQVSELIAAYDDLTERATRLATDHVVPVIVNPLAHAIASRP
ncbi:MAG: hypothetical protein JXQ73_30075 [Phycisphaerae bacterium]|nr:hypothetical protein [Phycisphaerae bacterium]